MKAKVKGGTLLETIIAMVITLSVFGIVMSIILKHETFSGSRAQVHCEILLSSIAENVKKDKTFIDVKFKSGGYFIEQTITDYKGKKGLLNLTLIAKDGSGNQVKQLHEVIREE